VLTNFLPILVKPTWSSFPCSKLSNTPLKHCKARNLACCTTCPNPPKSLGLGRRLGLSVNPSQAKAIIEPSSLARLGPAWLGLAPGFKPGRNSTFCDLVYANQRHERLEFHQKIMQRPVNSQGYHFPTPNKKPEYSTETIPGRLHVVHGQYEGSRICSDC
jgi:hypothetical protein